MAEKVKNAKKNKITCSAPLKRSSDEDRSVHPIFSPFEDALSEKSEHLQLDLTAPGLKG